MNNSHRASSLQHNAPFDSVAAQYDADFTDTRLGERKRQIVRAYVEKVLQQNWRVLELNCGTGHDALWLAERVQHVLATDVSEGMITVAREKARRLEASNIAFNQMAIEELWSTNELTLPDPAEQFNFVFSNFDGLNCVQNIALVPKGLHHILKPNGEAIVVLMSKFCIVETVGSALRGKFSAATGRFRKDVRTQGLQVNIGQGVGMKTWFHPTGKILQYFRKHGFRVVAVRGVGLTTPPTSMRDAYNRHITLFQRLHGLEDALSPHFPFNRMSDHILIHVQRIS